MDKTVKEAIEFLYENMNPMSQFVGDLVLSSLLETLTREELDRKLVG